MRVLRFVPVLLVALLLSACGDSPTGPDRSVVGTYQLATINASALPADIFGVEILSGSLSLKRDNTFSATSTSRYEDFETGEMITETETGTGTYTHDGTIIRFTEDGETIEATYDGRSITINAGIVVAVYRRS